MDIQKENDLLQEAFEVVTDEIGLCLDQKWGDYENPYENSDTALAFNLFKKGWQAKSQAVPEGFVLVPKVSLKVALSWMDADIDPWQMSSDCFSELYEHKPILEKAMEAQEQSHEG